MATEFQVSIDCTDALRPAPFRMRTVRSIRKECRPGIGVTG